jgi:hypothetical protein
MGSKNPPKFDTSIKDASLKEDPTTRKIIKKFMALVADVREKYLVAFLEQTGHQPEDVEMRYGIVQSIQGQSEGRVWFVKKGDSREKIALNQLCDAILAIDPATDTRAYQDIKERAGNLLEMFKIGE